MDREERVKAKRTRRSLLLPVVLLALSALPESKPIQTQPHRSRLRCVHNDASARRPQQSKRRRVGVQISCTGLLCAKRRSWSCRCSSSGRRLAVVEKSSSRTGMTPVIRCKETEHQTVANANPSAVEKVNSFRIVLSPYLNCYSILWSSGQTKMSIRYRRPILSTSSRAMMWILSLSHLPNPLLSLRR